MMQLNSDYQRDDFLKFLEEDFLTDFKRDIRPVITSSLTCINKAQYLGESKGLDLQVFEFIFQGSANKRVALTKDAFSIMRSSAIYNALAVFHSDDNKDWRFSLLTATPEPTVNGKVSVAYSNPKRLSFFLGPDAKVNTPTKFLVTKGKVADLEDLKSRFSIEVVNKEFYKDISQAFTKLVGGQLKLPSTLDKSKTNLEFAVRLIGRIIFCWFLREKKSDAGLSLMPKELLSIEAVKENKDYYHTILESIFFEVLNKPVKSRREEFTKEPFSFVPYLNGGLFSPQEDDFYKKMNGDFQSQFHNTLIIPDSWLNSFFEILETYNFTIDENTSYDEELSIDPEMLGRIFENLLAEINPETGESVRKSTGSYYTPRTIVNYMVDESLLLYLKEQTGTKEEKLRAVLSYDLGDDSKNPISREEKEKIIEALEKVKILDPACGSGAFPIGALQKIVFILQQIDPDADIWKKQQLSKADPEFKRDIENRFTKNDVDFLRKLAIIRKSIFGVDIQPIATEISRLRCFLTLIVDENINDNEVNRGIRPLPNLDFKFVTANSLINLPNINQAQGSMFDDYQKIDELKNIRDQYFNASGLEREQLKTEFVMQQKRLIDQLIKEHGFMGVAKAELTQKLADWEPFAHKSTLWFDPEWMFGIKEGFDIVISNPPYSELRDLEEEQQEAYRKAIYYEYARGGRVNLFQFFYPLAISIARSSGIICLITQNSILCEDSTLNNRKFIINNSKIIRFVSFPERDDHKKRVFEGVKMSVCIGILCKTSVELKEYEFDINVWRDKYMLEGHLLKLNITDIKSTFPLKLIFPFSTQESFKLLKKIKSLEQKFYVDSKAGEVDMTKCKKYFNRSKKGYRVITGAQILRFKISETPSQGNVLYLETSVLPFDLRQDFNDDRIAMQRITGVDSKIRLISTLIPHNLLCANSVNYITGKNGDLAFILGILNSKLINFYFKQTSTNTNVTTSEINSIPIPNVNPEKQKEMINLINRILEITKENEYMEDVSKQKNVKDYEKQIDQLVYKLYNLTPDDVRIIENN